MKKLILFFILLFAFIQLFFRAGFAQQTNIINKNYVETNGRNTIKAVYPHVDFGPDALMGMRGVAGVINSAIESLVLEQVHIFKTMINEKSEKKSMRKEKILLIISYDTIYYNSNFFSFRFHVYRGPPSTTPNLYTHDVSFNYCPTSIGLLKFSDLFLLNSDYLKYISGRCLTILKSIADNEGMIYLDDMIIKGAGENISNFKVFNINSDSLIITFNPAQVLPAENGFQTVSIPLQELKSRIDPNGPL